MSQNEQVFEAKKEGAVRQTQRYKDANMTAKNTGED